MRTVEEMMRKRNEASSKKGVLNQEQVLRIKRALARDEHPCDIAELFGVSPQTITRIRDRKTWGWLKTGDDMPVVVLPPATQAEQKDIADSQALLLSLLREPEQAGSGSKPKPEDAVAFFMERAGGKNG